MSKKIIISITSCLFFVVIPVWIWMISPELTKLPKDFSYSQITEKMAGGQFENTIEEKDLNVKDEVGTLAKSFSNMAVKLGNAYRNLEEKVKERTAEVEEKNKKLEASETELKKALDMSEQANKLMVGRELEMVKLKGRIKELEAMK